MKSLFTSWPNPHPGLFLCVCSSPLAVFSDPQRHAGLGQRLIQEQHPHHVVLGQRGEFSGGDGTLDEIKGAVLHLSSFTSKSKTKILLSRDRAAAVGSNLENNTERGVTLRVHVGNDSQLLLHPIWLVK